MIHGGSATIFVADMNVAIEFYTRTLGLNLRLRAGDDWAEIDAGSGLVIGLHPSGGPHHPAPSTAGSIQIGLNVDERLEDVMTKLAAKGVAFHGPVSDDGNVRLAFLSDPDGNAIYLVEVKYAGAHGAQDD